MKRTVQLTIWIWLFAATAAVAQTQTITLEPVQDATIYEEGSNNPNGGEVANGGGMYLLTGRTSRYGVRRPLLQFDVASALPPDAVVTNAILNLTLQQWYIDNGQELNINRQMFAHRVLSDWNVGTSGDGTTSLGGGGFDATAGDATWTDRFYGGEQWDMAGGDFSPEPSGNGLIWPRIEGRSFSWGDPEMADDVNDWLANPADNHGWIMIANEEDEQSIARFYASEWTEVDERPQLFLTYEIGGDEPTNLIEDGDFSSGIGSWWDAANDGTANTISTATGELCNTITAAGVEPWDIVIGYNGLNMMAGQWYEIAFDAVSTVPRTINFKTGLAEAPYTDYFVTTVNVGTTSERISVKFNNVIADPDTQFQFHLGGQVPAEICIDNVSIMETTADSGDPFQTQSQTGTPLRGYSDVLNMGTAVETGTFLSDPEHNTILAGEFNLFTPSNAMKMEPLVGTQGNYTWDTADAMVDFAEANDMIFHGHALVWHIQQPAWLENGQFDQAEMLDEMVSHIDTVMGRYAGRIAYWDVVNEAIHTTTGAETGSAPYALRSTIWRDRIGDDYIDLAFRRARAADPNAILLYNDYNISQMGHNKSDAVFEMVRDLKAGGTPIDQVGMQMHYTVDDPPNVQAVIDNFARYAEIGVDVQVTEIDVRIPLPADAAEVAIQDDIYRQMLRACIDAPNCNNFTTWGLSDIDSWIPGWFDGSGSAHIFDDMYNAKSSYDALIEELESGAVPAVTVTPTPMPSATDTPMPVATNTPVPNTSGNIITNGTFNGDTAWETYDSDGSAHSVTYTNNEACLDITNVGENPWSIALRQQIGLVQGQTYQLTFDARANDATQFRMRIGSPVDPFPDYFAQADVPVGTTTAPQTFQFAMDMATDTAATLDFQVANELATTICFSDVSLVEVSGTNPIPTTVSYRDVSVNAYTSWLWLIVPLIVVAMIGARRLSR